MNCDKLLLEAFENILSPDEKKELAKKLYDKSFKCKISINEYLKRIGFKDNYENSKGCIYL